LKFEGVVGAFLEAEYFLVGLFAEGVKTAVACVQVEIYESPVFQEGMYPYDRTCVTCEVLPALGRGELLFRVLSVEVHDAVPVFLVHFGGL
jgi:hypothetical protein